jgi:plastocyanin
MRSLFTAFLVLLASSSLAGGAVTGKITFTAVPPEPVALKSKGDPACKNARDETVLLGKDGKTLQNVLVQVVDAPAGPSNATASAPVTIEARGCLYQPRVSGAVVGQQVLVRNSDATLHTVMAHNDRKDGQPRELDKRFSFLHRPVMESGEVRVIPPAAAEVVRIDCGVFQWMRAYVLVSPSPYFAVTGTDGSFRIDGVPPGTWKIEAWHEKFGLKRGQVQVEDGKPATVSFSFP